MIDERISAIVPTIGRPESLARLLRSLTAQTLRVDEVVVADGSSDEGTATVISDPRWARAGLVVRRVAVSPPHAVRQRSAAIAASTGTILLMLDDDVALSHDFTIAMLRVLTSLPTAVAAVGVDDRQSDDGTTRLVQFVLKAFYGYPPKQWQGKLIGPLLKFGYWPLPDGPVGLEWFAAGAGAVRRDVYIACGGYSDFFLDRATINEDMDLAIKIRRHGDIFLCPDAKFSHYHDPGGRLSVYAAGRDDAYNRFVILRSTLQKTRLQALCSMALLISLEAVMAMASLRRGRQAAKHQMARVGGLVAGLSRGIRFSANALAVGLKN